MAPPHNVASLRLCISAMENIDSDKTTLFASPSSKLALADETPISLKSNQSLGIIPNEPVALVSEVVPKAGMKPGTETFCVKAENHSPLAPRFRRFSILSF